MVEVIRDAALWLLVVPIAAVGLTAAAIGITMLINLFDKDTWK